MHLAGKAFDSAYEGWNFEDPGSRQRFRSVVRLAALCHDLGHSPFSHCTEFAMPALETLSLSWYNGGATTARRATHEDYTIGFLQHESLASLIAAHFPFSSRHVAALISWDVDIEDSFFVDNGLNHREILSQIISSEMDVDRLDYLVRDSYYSGARYGQVDVGWLLTNMEAYAHDGRVSLALDSKAIYAFDDFMIARHHMFLMVYFHHKSVVYEELMKRWVTSDACDWVLPADMEEYMFWDDSSLQVHLRHSKNEWARRIVERRPYRRVYEAHGTPDEVDLTDEVALLKTRALITLRLGLRVNFLATTYLDKNATRHREFM